MRFNKKILSTVLSMSMALALMLNPMSVMAADNSTTNSDETIVIEQEDDSIIKLTPLSEEEVAVLLENEENQQQTRIENEVYAAPVKVDSSRVAVDFTNKGFILDFVDYVQTNLIIWHAIDDNPVGYRMEYIKLPHGTHRTKPVYVSGWHRAQTIGGFYIDGFGKEVGIGTASGYVYN